MNKHAAKPLDRVRWERARAIFEAALDLPEVDRTPFVDTSCHGDADVRAEVVSLLAADVAAGGEDSIGVVSGSAEQFASVVLEDLPSAPHPRAFGAYRVVGPLGEGGMGVVYEAEQDNPRRRVAVKVVRGGTSADELQVRLFRREVQALARLRHPGIAAIYEAGSDDHGRHWFAMELVRGEPLDRDWRRAGGPGDGVAPDATEIRRRAARILQVAEIVAYAHQRGVIHRDLKPSNILVVDPDPAAGRVDPIGAVKILDFGLARITAEELDTTVARTQEHAIRGTLPYMSPEQARAEPAEIDTRTDVYAIGVLLYQALTGTLPHELDRMSLPSALRVLCEENPRAPRARNRLIPSDLEAIVQKAIEKDPSRRYASASMLADDLRRFLHDLPVHARPPGAWYVLRKTAARHRTASLLGAALLAAVVLGSVGTTVGMVRARHAAAEARAEAETAAQVSRFLEDLFRVSDPGEARGNSITARELLDQGAARIGQGLRDQPLVQGRLLGTMGEVYRKLGLYRDARPLLEQSVTHLRESLGDGHPEVARQEYALAGLLRRMGEFEASGVRYERALEIREAKYGPDHPDVAASLTGLANLRLELGRYDEARPLYERAIRIIERSFGPDDPAVAAHLFNYALLLQRIGESEAALPLQERVVALHEKSLGPDHPEVAADLMTLAHACREVGDTTRARACLERALTIQELALGPDHTDVAETLAGIGSLHLAREDGPPAVRACERSLDILRRALGDEHPTAAMVEANLGMALRLCGRVTEAAACGERALRAMEEALGPEHEYTAAGIDYLAGHYAAAGEALRARALFERALRIRSELYGVDSYRCAETLWGLAGVLEGSGETDAARELYERGGRARLTAGPAPDPVWQRRFAERIEGLRHEGAADSALALEAAVELWRSRKPTAAIP